MTPATRKSWLVVPALFHIGQVGQIGNIVFHQGCKARAFHSSGYQPPVKLMRQVDLVILLLDAAGQQSGELAGSLEYSVPLANGNAIRDIPRKFLQGTDQAFVGTLWAVFGEWRLQKRKGSVRDQ